MSTAYDWQEEAACRGVSGDTFFNDDKKDITFKTFCNECPVVGECLEYALIYDMKGTWGGMTERERSRIPRKNIKFLRADAEESGLFNAALKV
ncbi:WhiB family transcriptional regulator [Streptomyces sp. NPDC012769]|uniref:WhiB family transcriptional regulator n=1 Tax=Streptomyces sp. NPDC012769 TaxID=3364848 RepID=UPI0036C64062